ncbi:VWA domain-containing protein [Treponema sp. OttesenSCG-928-L16]|nr:VWA domain-containing protein [Treponema sp. OttesenSCG-928-L16]
MKLEFERPLILFAGLLALVLIYIFSRFLKDFFILKIPLGPPGGTPFSPPLRMDIPVKILKGFELLGLILLISAAASPVLVSSEMVWFTRGADILFVLDISPSMAGVDMNGKNRFDAARDLVYDFAERRPSDSIGLVGIGLDAALFIPPTADRNALYARLESLRIGELGDGTALGMGLAVAALHIRESKAVRKAVVLITDGENNAGPVHPETAAEFLRSTGASLWVVGLGSTGEVPIDYVDPLSRTRRTGTFDSRFNPESLRALARSGGGTYLSAPSAEAFSAAFSQIDAGEMTVGRALPLRNVRNIYQPFAAAALILICAARIIRRYVLGALL